MQYLEKDRMISVCFKGKPFNNMVIQVYARINNAEEAEVEWFYDDLQNLLDLKTKKRCPFHYRGLESKVGSQKIHGVTGKYGFGTTK